MLKTASEVVAQDDLRAAVDFAIELNREVSASKRELDRIKEHLRKVGRENLGSGVPGVELEGNIGVVYIVFPEEEVRTVKGKDLREIEVNLSPATFARLFTKQITVKPVEDFIAKCSGLTEAERAVVTQFCQVITPTGKVNLPK